MQFTLAALALLSVATAAPTHPLSIRGSSTTFNLVYKSAGNAPDSVAALNSGTWYVGNRGSDLVLYPSSDSASLLYKYGNDPRIATADTGIVITPGGTATVPAARPIQFVPNNGTEETNIELNDSGLPTLWYENGRFQACAGNDDDEIYVGYVAPGQRFYADCAPVELLAVCSTTGSGSDSVGQLGSPVYVACEDD